MDEYFPPADVLCQRVDSLVALADAYAEADDEEVSAILLQTMRLVLLSISPPKVADAKVIPFVVKGGG